MVKFDSVNEFDEACGEIRLLLGYSKKNASKSGKYATFNKAAIVLLCAKFEAFFEDFLEEYSFYHLSASSNHSVDRCLYDHVVDCVITSLELAKNKPAKKKDALSKLAKLCGSEEIRPMTEYSTDPKLRMGKHGQGEIERLLATFGFKEFIALDIVKQFFVRFNSLNNIRNNIVHEDATPSLTHQDVKGYLDAVSGFIKELAAVAGDKAALAI